MFSKLKCFGLLFILWSTLSFGQEKGKIAGKIQDAASSEDLIGVAIGVKGTSLGASTDIEGHYFLSLDPGTYTFVVSYVGYKTKEITDVIIASGETVNLNVTIEESVNELEEVVITATFKKESVDALVLERKNAVSVSDGISADLIRKTPDRNTADVLKRVSGASIQDNKFAIIRGLNERYNTAFVNNAPLPSSEPDRKAFAFDIFPSGIVESINIYKTATPDLPGDFAGGVIKIKTRDIPDENFYSLTLGGRYNTVTTFQPGYKYHGGKTDWLGVDDGTRKLSKDMPGKEDIEPNYDNVTSDDQKYERTNAAMAEAKRGAQSFTNNWDVSKISSMSPGTNFQFLMGKKIKNLGVIFSLSHSSTNRNVESTIADYQLDGRPEYLNDDRSSFRDILWGGMANVSYKLHENHKFSIKNTYNINSSDLSLYREGSNYYSTGTKYQVYSTQYTQNRLNAHQLSGDHFFKRLKLKGDWIVGYSEIRRLVPDYKILTYSKNIDAPDSVKYKFNSVSTDPRTAGRFFSTMDENIKSGGFDLSRPLPNVWLIKTELKGGVYIQERERKFVARQFVFDRNQGFNDAHRSNNNVDSLETLPPSQILSPENFNYTYNQRDASKTMVTVDDNGNVVTTDLNGNPLPPIFLGTYTIREATTKTDSYIAGSSLKAAYFMLDHRFLTYARFSWGFRYEYFNQRLRTEIPAENRKVDINSVKEDWLPSLNLTLSPLTKVNLRLAYSKTLNRPEFRELAPFSFYDITISRTVIGNDSLKRATVNNYDARLEYFPGAGQVLSVTYFVKNFSNPIERYFPPDAGGIFIVYNNAKSATVSGWEFEARQNLQFISKNNKILSRLTLSGNYALINSNTHPSEKNLKYTADNRPLQGQSNYIFNGNISYDDQDHGFNVALAVNRVGRRLYIVGNFEEPDVWENPRTILDFTVSQAFIKKRLEAKLTVGDWLRQTQYFYQDIDKNKRFNDDKDLVIFKYKYGTNVTLNLTYKF